MKLVKFFVLFCLVAFFLIALPTVTAHAAPHSNGPDRRETKKLHHIQHKNKVEYGEASWYGPNFFGKEKANGDIYRRTDFHIAHKTLPLGSTVRITNLTNGKSVVAEVEDRGPYIDGRIIDASKKVAEALGFTGVTDVKVVLISMR
jgi:rare lipoprotein A (peptidoglycan hydrolase)